MKTRVCLHNYFNVFCEDTSNVFVVAAAADADDYYFFIICEIELQRIDVK